MAEYIVKEALKQRLEASPLFSNFKAGGIFIKGGILDLVEKHPAADVVEVVRCGECKKMMTTDCMLCSFSNDGYCTGGPNDDFYCADGERREKQ